MRLKPAFRIFKVMQSGIVIADSKLHFATRSLATRWLSVHAEDNQEYVILSVLFAKEGEYQKEWLEENINKN